MSSGKTNKSFSKRIKLTRTGKLKVRKGGGNHFNAKESRSKQLNRKRGNDIVIPTKVANRELPHHNTK